MEMVKIKNGGITMTVPAQEVDFYTRAGYAVVKEKPEKPERGKKLEAVAEEQPPDQSEG